MNKTITFEFEGKDYRLEFTRKSVETMEKRGFVAEDIVKRPMTMLPELFAGAFLANHKFVKRETIDMIFGKLGGKQELIGALAEMYQEPLLTLVEDSEDTGGNAGWERSW